MKFLTVTILLLFNTLNVFAQENPIKWTTKAEKINATEYNLIIDGEIQAGWNIYSQFLASDDGPVRTTFTFDKEGYELVGKTEENGNRKEGFDEMFGMNVIKFSKHVTYTQKIKINSGVKSVKTTVNFMTCNDEVCLPPRDVNFAIPLQ
jgi:thiol:disulfide interchange protein DsbD